MQNQNFSTAQIQKASQTQIQKMSQKQIQAINFLSLSNKDLREEIYKMVQENPALEIVEDIPVNITSSILNSDDWEKAIENYADNSETLQEHLLHQLNMINLSDDEKNFCTSLIYNLDRNGCCSLSEVFLDKSNPNHDDKFIAKCKDIVQRLDPIGTCCVNVEESLFVQAKILNPDDALALFILDGHLEFLNPPEPEKILRKILAFQKDWHSKAFATQLPIDSLKIDENVVQNTLKFILSLNPHPAQNFSYDSTKTNIQLADIALIVEKKVGNVLSDNFEKGIVKLDEKNFFQVKYPSGELPEIRIAPEFEKKSDNKDINLYRQKYFRSACDFLENLNFRKSTIVLQGSQIVKEQIDFFENGPGHLKPLTRRNLAKKIGVHESTVSRVSSKHNPRFIQTDWGFFPLSYFFPSGVGEKSAEEIKFMIKKILDRNGKKKISDKKICDELNSCGIEIARRTVAKYRKSISV